MGIRFAQVSCPSSLNNDVCATGFASAHSSAGRARQHWRSQWHTGRRSLGNSIRRANLSEPDTYYTEYRRGFVSRERRKQPLISSQHVSKRLLQPCHRRFTVLAVDDDVNANLARVDHFDIDPGRGQGSKHANGDAGVGTQSDAGD